MKRLLPVCLLLAGCTYVPPGSVGVLVNLYGNDKGVREQVVGPGRYFLTLNENLYEFPVYTINYTWTKSQTEGKNAEDESLTFQDKDGLVLNGDFGITYNIDPDHVVSVFQKYRKGVEEITDVFLRNSVRNALVDIASTMGVEDIYGPKKQELVHKVFKQIHDEVAPIGINIQQLYLIGDFRLPPTVAEAINKKITATQNAMTSENEIAQARAEAQKRIIQAEAEATANMKIGKSITPEYIQYLFVMKWPGGLPQVLSLGGNQGLSLLLEGPKKAAAGTAKP